MADIPETPAPKATDRARTAASAAGSFVSIYVGLALPALWAGVGPLGVGAIAMAMISLLLAGTLIALSTVDWLEHRLPDVLTLPLIIAGLALHVMDGREVLVDRCLGAIAGYGSLHAAEWLYRRWRGRAGLGLGDAKLFAAAGAWLGLSALPFVMLGASLSALVAVALLGLAGRPMTMTSRLAFGPWLAVAFWAIWLYGPIGD